MKKSVREFAKFAALPIALMFLLAIFLGFYRFFDLPSFEEIIAFAKAQFEKRGYIVIFVAALLEGFLLVNWFFPGTVVIVIGAIFAFDGAQSVVLSAFLVFLGLFLMSILNFILGKYGWYKLLVRFGLGGEIEKMKKRIEKHGLKILLVTYFHPHVGSLSATAAGILQIKSRKFIIASLFVFSIWIVIWTMLCYLFGDELLKIINFKSLLIIVAVWIAFLGIKYIFAKKGTEEVTVLDSPRD